MGFFKETFRSLRVHNYRLWAAGALVSNLGTWMQRIAQNWLVLTVLTDNNASAMGLIMALQFGPTLVLLPWVGPAADRFDRRKLLATTQVVQGMLALGLGLLTISGQVQLWHVYLFALLLGCATAFDSPARHAFVAELVGEADLSNAVALNSTSFNAARMVGPAMVGVLIGAVGTGWVFLLNAASFIAVIGSLLAIRVETLHRGRRPASKSGGLIESLRYIWRRPDLVVVFLMLFLVSAFGLNFQIFIAAMAVTVFHAGAEEFGLLSSAMAVGTVTGALLAARRGAPRFATLVGGATILGGGSALAAVMPTTWLFGLALVLTGVAAQTFITTANSFVQLRTDSFMRGRVMAFYLAILLGCTPIGSPVVGWVADFCGPRWALGVGALACLVAAGSGIGFLRRDRSKRTREGGNPPPMSGR